MKLLLVAASLVLAASAGNAPIMQDYHREFGIAAAARVKAMEEAQDFDGSRIAGGSEAALREHPYFAGLLVILVSGFMSICGSSMLSNTKLVTAAHCWAHGSSQAHQFTVVLGSLRLYSGGERINTRIVEQHAGYNQRTLENDIAMITIPYVAFTPYRSNIRIATGSDLFAGSWAVITGFGRTGDRPEDFSFDPALRKANVQIITNEVCALVFPDNVFESTICVSTQEGRSPCAGDSGGPLAILSGRSGTLLGVTSFGHRDGCTAGHPSAFTRISSYTMWIRHRIGFFWNL